MRRHFMSFGAAVLIAAPLAGQGTYAVTSRFPVGGEGSWDYLSIDTAGNRLFVARQNRVMVLDPATGKVLGEIPGFNGAHGVAFAYSTGHGFATSGRDSTVIMFDLTTLKVLARTTAAEDADAILYDPASKHVFTFNGDAESATVIDASTGARIRTIALGAKPEFGVAAGDGKLYVNLTEKGVVAEIDAVAMRVIRQWSVAPCTASTGLAIDVAHHRLFSACRSKHMAISDIVAGKLVATLPIGGGVDAAAFDPATQLAFASNGDGTLTVVHEDSPSKFTVVATVPTGTAAKTMALDPRTHRVYLGSATFQPAPPATPANPRPRPQMSAGSFVLLVLSPPSK
jgi:YVTN family beta-propeller protein